MLNSKASILMVDDKPENLIALEAVLSPLGHELIGLRSGEDVLRFILKEDVEQLAVILLDVQMQGMDGFETARLIKSREKTKEIPIIFITAQSKSLDNVLYGYHLGSVDYIFKPFHPELLQRKVEAFVTLHRYHQQIKEQGKLLEKRANELELMNKKLRKAEALARMVSETSIDSIITCDEQGTIVSINPAVESMFMYASIDLLGKPMDIILPHVQACHNTGTFLETIAYRKDGTTFPADIQVGKATVDEQAFYVYSIRDITEKKLIEKERNERTDILEKMVVERTRELVKANNKLRKSREHFEKLFISSPSLIAIRRLSNMTYLDVNESWLRFTGYTKEELIGHKLELFTVSEDDSSQNLYTVGERCMNVQVQFSTKRGELKEGLLSVEILEIADELCELCVIVDITEKINWEKEMVRLGKLNLIGEMAAGIAHEIRNPMTVIKGFLQMYKKNQSMSPKYIDIMLDELSRANSIITEYLSLSKNKPAYLEPRNLNKIIESLLPLLKADAMLTGKHIETNYGDCPDIDLDEKEIRQLILNLAINGLEAMETGKVLSIATYQQEESIILKIQDQGSGIPPKFMDKLGTPFFTTKENGTGLGLAICFSIASRNGAMIHIDSSPDGTTVYVKFKMGAHAAARHQ